MDREKTVAPDRRGFLGAGVIAAAGVAGVAALAGDASAAPGGTALPNLYPQWNAREFRAITAHENAHVPAVIALIQSIGGTPRPKPNFKNILSPNVKAFATTALTQENTGVGAFRGSAPIILQKNVLDAAASIQQIEARHVGYLNLALNQTNGTNLFGQDLSFERPLTLQEIIDAATPFIQDLNGGPPIAFNATPSRANDIAILNTALVLEYLEREFYNLNVPRFFPS